MFRPSIRPSIGRGLGFLGVYEICDVFCLENQAATIKNCCDFFSHTIHGTGILTYIWYHLVDFYGKCRQTCQSHGPWMVSVWLHFGGRSDSDLLQVLYCSICQGDLAKAGSFRWNQANILAKKWEDTVDGRSPASLGGGFKHFLYFHPEPWGNDPIWRIFFQMGWNHQLDYLP